MKDINKEEVSDFERSWQKAFENAEEMPANDLWSAIDAQLANKDTQRYKRKTIFYKWVAAAAVVFAIGLSYFSYTINTDKQFLIAEHNSTNAATAYNSEKEGERASKSLSNKAKIKENVASHIEPIEESIREKTNGNNPIARTEMDKVAAKTGTLRNGTSSSELNEAIAKVRQEFPTGKSSEKVAIQRTENPKESDQALKTFAADPVKRAEGMSYDLRHYAQLLDPPYLYAIPGVMINREQKTENDKMVLWAGLNIGSSMFDPNFQQGSNFQPQTSPALSQTFARVAPQAATLKENTEAGVSYSIGLNFGLQLTEKWVIQSGVRYAHKSASTNSTTYLKNNFNGYKTPTYLGDTENDMLATTSEKNFSQEYDLLNRFEFASIPLKAGYLLIDKKIGLMLTAGIGADIFLSNTISETHDKLASVTVDAGSDSPFREVNFNGLFGAEVFYEISNQYHLTLEPNYSIALSPFTKSDTGFKSTPQTFGLTAGLRYFWK